jgi:hypothetical protein
MTTLAIPHKIRHARVNTAKKHMTGCWQQRDCPCNVNMVLICHMAEAFILQNSYTHLSNCVSHAESKSTWGFVFSSTTIHHNRFDFSGFDWVTISVTSRIRIIKDEMWGRFIPGQDSWQPTTKRLGDLKKSKIDRRSRDSNPRIVQPVTDYAIPIPSDKEIWR